jgi:DNA-binding transcriptional ArsR family regulator
MTDVAQLPDDLIDGVARRFRALADPTRLRLLNELGRAGELPVGTLSERAGAGLSNTSKHLRLLEREGLVARRRSGTTILYRVDDPTLAEICDLSCSALRQRYRNLAARGGPA